MLEENGISAEEAIGEAKALYAKEKNKGGLGQLLEKYFFHYTPNSDQNPDFPKAGVELKVTPYRINQDKSRSAKERLIITMIDYMSVVNESFYDSHFWNKAKLILLIYYLYEMEVRDRLDYRISYSQLFTPPENDLPTIIHDFETIVNKIRSGKAHELSGADTDYLEAATKSSDSTVRRPQPFSSIPAKPRAFAFKNSYMTYILNTYVIPKKDMVVSSLPNSEGHPLEKFVTDRIDHYKGQTLSALSDIFGITSTAKNLPSLIVFKILGVTGNQVEEFKKANIVVKTIRIEENGKIKEHMSFPTFKFKDLVNETWDDAVFGNYLRDTRFFFVVYKKNSDGEYILKGSQFWNIPYSDLEGHVHSVWAKTKQVLSDGLVIEQKGKKSTNNFPKHSEDRICHVRPHAQNSNDTYELPDGRYYPKQCFWLSNEYIASQLKKEFFE